MFRRKRNPYVPSSRQMRRLKRDAKNVYRTHYLGLGKDRGLLKYFWLGIILLLAVSILVLINL